MIKYLNLIEKFLEKKAKIAKLPLQKGDVKDVYSDITKIKNKLGYRPKVQVEKGVSEFINWYRSYYKV